MPRPRINEEIEALAEIDKRTAHLPQDRRLVARLCETSDLIQQIFPQLQCLTIAEATHLAGGSMPQSLLTYWLSRTELMDYWTHYYADRYGIAEASWIKVIADLYNWSRRPAEEGGELGADHLQKIYLAGKIGKVVRAKN